MEEVLHNNVPGAPAEVPPEAEMLMDDDARSQTENSNAHAPRLQFTEASTNQVVLDIILGMPEDAKFTEVQRVAFQRLLKQNIGTLRVEPEYMPPVPAGPPFNEQIAELRKELTALTATLAPLAVDLAQGDGPAPKKYSREWREVAMRAPAPPLAEMIMENNVAEVQQVLTQHKNGNNMKMKIMGTAVNQLLQGVDLKDNKEEVHRRVTHLIKDRLGALARSPAFNKEVESANISATRGNTPTTQNQIYVTIIFPHSAIRDYIWKNRHILRREGAPGQYDIQIGAVLSWVQRQYRSLSIEAARVKYGARLSGPNADLFLVFNHHSVSVGHKDPAARPANPLDHIIPPRAAVLQLLPDIRRAVR